MCCALVYCLVVDLTISVLVSVGLLLAVVYRLGCVDSGSVPSRSGHIEVLCQK